MVATANVVAPSTSIGSKPMTLAAPAIDVLRGDYGPEDSYGGAGGDDGGAEVEVAAFAAQVEEAVPC